MIRFGREFEAELLWQSVIMSGAMLLLIRLAVSINRTHLLPPSKPASAFGTPTS